jgi:hypothetical protein
MDLREEILLERSSKVQIMDGKELAGAELIILEQK